MEVSSSLGAVTSLCRTYLYGAGKQRIESKDKNRIIALKEDFGIALKTNFRWHMKFWVLSMIWFRSYLWDRPLRKEENKSTILNVEGSLKSREDANEVDAFLPDGFWKRAFWKRDWEHRTRWWEKELVTTYPHEVSSFILSLGTSVATLWSAKTAPSLNDGYEYVFPSSQQPMGLANMNICRYRYVVGYVMPRTTVEVLWY